MKRDNHENWQDPHPPVAFSPVFCNEQVLSCVLEQRELGRVPLSAVLFWRERICSEGGKPDGRGGWRLLLVSRSCVSAKKEEMVPGMVPVREVVDRSRSLREAWRVELDERDERGLVRF